MFDRSKIWSWLMAVGLLLGPVWARAQDEPAPAAPASGAAQATPPAPGDTPAAQPPKAMPAGSDTPLPGPPSLPEVALGPVLKTVPVRRDQTPPNTQTIDSRPLTTDRDGIWVLDFAYKPIRIVTVDIPNVGRRYIHYLSYRVINKTGKPRMFVPQFILVTDTGKRYEDTVLPAAVEIISKREHLRDNPGAPLLGAVDVVGVLPPSGDREGIDDALFGVAIWKDVDPNADGFSVFVRGLSDGQIVQPEEVDRYERKVRLGEKLTVDELKGAPVQDKPVVLYKTLVIDFVRPGDQFDLNEREIFLKDPPYADGPWVYTSDPLLWYGKHRPLKGVAKPPVASADNTVR